MWQYYFIYSGKTTLHLREHFICERHHVLELSDRLICTFSHIYRNRLIIALSSFVNENNLFSINALFGCHNLPPTQNIAIMAYFRRTGKLFRSTGVLGKSIPPSPPAANPRPAPIPMAMVR